MLTAEHVVLIGEDADTQACVAAKLPPVALRRLRCTCRGASGAAPIGVNWARLSQPSELAAAGEIRALKYLYLHDKDNLDPFDTRLRNVLIFSSGDQRRMLIEAGAGLDATDAQGRTALMFDCRNGNTDAAREHIAAGADTWKSSEGKCAIKLAMEGRHWDCVIAVAQARLDSREAGGQ